MGDYVDLHLHTDRSDGSMSPAQVVAHSKLRGLRAIAITDHDTVSGDGEAIIEGGRQGVEVIPGVELSIVFQPGEFHLLGYYLDFTDAGLLARLEELRERRKKRNPLILCKLRELGISLDIGEIRDRAGNGNVGRPHIAAAIVSAGRAKSVQDAFDRFLKKGGPAYVPKEILTPQEGISLIQSHGGVPVLAHPSTLEIGSAQRLYEFVKNLKRWGLKGVEVYYGGGARRKTQVAKSVAKRLGLCMTGGSDFHGASKPNIEIGSGRGDLMVDYEAVEQIRSCIPATPDPACEAGTAGTAGV